MSGGISPSYSKSAPCASSIRTASCSFRLRGPGGLPKAEYDMKATRGVKPSLRTAAAAVRAISTSSWLSGNSVTLVSATKIGRPLASTMLMPITRPAGRGIDHPHHLAVGLVEVARDAGDHAVGVAHRHHGGGEAVAVQVDQPLDVAAQVPLPLQPAVEVLHVLGVTVGRPAR
jgi:hypothetical protein